MYKRDSLGFDVTQNFIELVFALSRFFPEENSTDKDRWLLIQKNNRLGSLKNIFLPTGPLI
ncbi:hypothetical protein HZS_4279 [Henneguya salminicola]|nr:hypothetical protein HZS_4279 [Henneguya salminicola]